jgi:hypothetical protein
VAEDGMDDSRSNVFQLGLSAAALLVAGEGVCCIPVVVPVVRRGRLLHPGGHAGGDSEERFTAAVARYFELEKGITCGTHRAMDSGMVRNVDAVMTREDGGTRVQIQSRGVRMP